MPDVWQTSCPRGHVIDDWSIVGGRIYVKRLKDVKTETRLTRWTENRGTVDFDGIGSASALDGRNHGPLRVPQLRVVYRAAYSLSARYADRQARGLSQPKVPSIPANMS